MQKIRVAVIFGGTNTEHEVSIVSAQAILANLDHEKYDIVPILITKENTWLITPQLQASYSPVLSASIASPAKSFQSIGQVIQQTSIDVVFPVIHGPYGEDGTIQGLLELARIPYVGCNVASSAICMDKILQKKVCQSCDIPIAPHVWFTQSDWNNDEKQILDKIKKELSGKYPYFVKPSNQGSSVGISKAHNRAELIEGINEAITRDFRIVVEQAIPNVREIECSILGSNSNPQVSVLGEIIPDQEFYSYESKYLSGNSQAIIPAKLSTSITREIQAIALKSFKVLDCFGLARIDFLLNSQTSEYFLNEVNTMPGFTPISMYPKLWDASGKSYPELLDDLINLALTRSKMKSKLNFSR